MIWKLTQERFDSLCVLAAIGAALLIFAHPSPVEHDPAELAAKVEAAFLDRGYRLVEPLRFEQIGASLRTEALLEDAAGVRRRKICLIARSEVDWFSQCR
jgi:hypothetical protein